MTFGGIVLALFAMVGVATVGAFCVFFVEAWSERTKRERYERQQFERREKAKIVHIGTIIRDAAGGEYPYGFTLDCQERIPPFGRGPNGETLCGNWTNAELVEVAKRRKEWES